MEVSTRRKKLLQGVSRTREVPDRRPGERFQEMSMATTEWKETTLGDVCLVESGGTPSTANNTYWSGSVSWITPRDLASHEGRWIEQGEKNITEEGLRNSSARLLPKNTVLFSSRAPIGYVAIAARELATNQGLKNLVCDEKETHYKFIYYWLKANVHAIERRASGSTFAEASATVMKTQEVLLPPLDEQRSIATVLSSLDDKIELLRRQNETLEQIAQAIFNEWFVKPTSKRVPLRELVEFNPATPLKKGTVAAYFDMGALPTVGSWPEEPIQRPFGSGAKFQNGDTLLARITPCLENGKTAFVQRLKNGEVAWGSTEFIVIRPNSPLPPTFGYLLARNPSFRDFTIRAMTGTSGRQRVQVDMLLEYEVSMPSDDVISEFSHAVEVIFSKIKNNAEQADTLAATRDALLPRLMSGEIRV